MRFYYEGDIPTHERKTRTVPIPKSVVWVIRCQTSFFAWRVRHDLQHAWPILNRDGAKFSQLLEPLSPVPTRSSFETYFS